MQKQVQLRQMNPTAEFVNGQVRIHEHGQNERFSFDVKGDIPYLPICDELINKMRAFGTFALNLQKQDLDRQEKSKIYQDEQMKLWQFAARVEDKLNKAHRK